MTERTEREIMAVLKTNSLLLAVFAIVGILLSNNNSNMVAGQACINDLQSLRLHCAFYVQKNMPKTNPSPECCSVLMTMNMPCVCQHITKEIEQAIDMEKAVYAAKYCDAALIPGTMCGSKKNNY